MGSEGVCGLDGPLGEIIRQLVANVVLRENRAKSGTGSSRLLHWPTER